MSKSSPIDKQIIIEQRKEITHLQKLLVKKEVKHQSEIAELKALLAEEKKNKFKIVIQERRHKTTPIFIFLYIHMLHMVNK